MTDEFDFRAREEQLRALDAKLTAQNSMFVQRAESLLKAQGQRLRSSPSDVSSPTSAAAAVSATASTSGIRPPSSSGSRSSSRLSNSIGAPSTVAPVPSSSLPRAPPSPAVNRIGSSHGTNGGNGGMVTSPSRAAAASSSSGARPVSRHIVVAPHDDDDMDNGGLAAASSSSSRRHFEDIDHHGHDDGADILDNDDGDAAYGAPTAAAIAPSRSSRVTAANIGMDDEAADTLTGAGADAAQRYNRARITSLQSVVDKLTQANAAQDKELNAVNAKMKVFEDERKRLKRLIAQGEQTSEKQRQATSTAEEKALRLQREIDTLKRDLAASEKARKQLEVDSKNRDVRLNRAVAEADRLRVRTTQASENKSGESQAQRQLVAQLRADNKRLVTQKAELLAAFRKQFKLIDILKRQKLHMEAARLLAFTEDEFAKTLELGDS